MDDPAAKQDPPGDGLPERREEVSARQVPAGHEEEICVLTEASLRGEITDVEARRLEELLAGDAKQHRQYYLRYILQTISLRVWSASFAEFGERRTDAAGSVGSPPLSPGLRGGDGELRLRGLRKWGFNRYFALAAAALLAIGVGVGYLRTSGELEAHREPQPVASLAAGDEAQWRPGSKWQNGAPLMEGDVLDLVEGRAQVSMSCGAELVLTAPCSVVVVSSGEVLLREGRLSVSVAEWTRDFAVATSSVHITDLGKQFVVSADAKAGTVEAHAIDGALRVQTADLAGSPRGLLLSSGEAIRIRPAVNQTTRLKADQALFDAGFEVAGPFKPLNIRNTGQGLMAGGEDPHWRIVYCSDDSFAQSHNAVVCAALPPLYLLGNPSVSQWISSRVDTTECPPSTMWTFETEFNLSGYDVSSVTLAANIIADNGVTAVRLNGRRVPIKPWIESDPDAVFNSYRKIEVKKGFVEGVNRIQFDVWNAVLVADTLKPNPMGFRVEWQAYGRLKTVDATLASRTQRPGRSLDRTPTPLALPSWPEKHSPGGSSEEFLSRLGIVHPG